MNIDEKLALVAIYPPQVVGYCLGEIARIHQESLPQKVPTCECCLRPMGVNEYLKRKHMDQLLKMLPERLFYYQKVEAEHAERIAEAKSTDDTIYSRWKFWKAKRPASKT